MEYLTAIAAFIALVLSIINLRQNKIHSSPKPFIRPLSWHHHKVRNGLKEYCDYGLDPKDTYAPRAVVKNLGEGIAVKVNIYVSIINESGKEESFKLTGPDIISVNSEGEYKGEENQLLDLYTNISKLIIDYKSDVGYTRKAVWNVLGKENFNLELSK